MRLQDALKKRKSVRAYLDKEVPKAQIEKILNLAKHAPSGVNTQPWQVAVLTRESKQKLQTKLLQAFYDKSPHAMDYQYYPLEWKAPYSTRRAACGLQLYKSVGINKEDKERRREQWAANFRAFDAPVMLFFTMEDVMQTGSFLDFGMFLQSIMISATAEGLATCAQGALAEYSSVVKEALNIPQNTILVCGMALGYEDTSAPINQYRTPRLKLEEFVTYHD
jgi:nitroreductase